MLRHSEYFWPYLSFQALFRLFPFMSLDMITTSISLTTASYDTFALRDIVGSKTPTLTCKLAHFISSSKALTDSNRPILSLLRLSSRPWLTATNSCQILLERHHLTIRCAFLFYFINSCRQVPWRLRLARQTPPRRMRMLSRTC